MTAAYSFARSTFRPFRNSSWVTPLTSTFLSSIVFVAIEPPLAWSTCKTPTSATTRARLPALMRMIRIGNGQGFWGDNVDAPVELLRGGPIDYIGMDYLAEVTLSIMMRQKLKNPKLGYATDFIGFVRRVLPELLERNVRVITNAGGLNPKACRNRIFEVARDLGVTGLRIGVVEGDDLLPRLKDLIAAGHPLKNMETGEPMEKIVDQVMSANAYLGAWPVVEALAQGAHIVLCGRVTDTALALAPAIHEFGW